MKILSIGAEAVVYADGVKKEVIKQRQPKKYRIKELDDKLRLHRMRREAKVIAALQQLGVPVPKLIKTDEKTATITMRLIEGKKQGMRLTAAITVEFAPKLGNPLESCTRTT